MSILIEPTEPSEGQNNSTLTSDPNGPEQFWAGLRLACPVWKTKDLGTAGGGTAYTVGEAYVTGYLVPKLNGVAQDPTRISETDIDLGTFAFDVAPDSGWSVTVDYGVYCNKDLELQIPPLQGKGLPGKSNSGLVGRGSGPGARAIVTGVSAGAPRFAWTENIFASSPTWTSSATGLPASVSISRYAVVDPFAPSTTALIVLNQNAGNGDELWKNTAYRTGGTWTKVLDHGTIAHAGAATNFQIQDVAYTIAQPDLLYVYYGGTGIGCGVDHSHNNGTGWSATVLLSAVQNLGGNIMVGQHIPTKLYVYNPINSNPDTVYFSTDGAHSFSTILVTGFNGNNGAMPYATNTTDAELFVLAAGSGTGAIRRSIDSATSFASYASSLTIAETAWFFSPSNDGLAWMHDYTNALVYRSLDRALTWTSFATPGSAASYGKGSMALLRDIMFFLVTNSTTVPVQTSPDLSTWTNRTGNLITGVFTGASPQVTSIVPDWTT